MIAGLEEVSDGDLIFDEQVVNYVPPHKRDVAMVFQSYALYQIGRASCRERC